MFALGKTLHSPYETAESVEKTISAKIGKLDKMSIEASTRNAVKGLLDVNPSTRFSSQQAANLFSHHLLKPSNSTNDGVIVLQKSLPDMPLEQTKLV